MNLSPAPTFEPISDYVAELQLHMALQARNLLPNIDESEAGDPRTQLLHETQAQLEKLISRQGR
ncbi:MAG: hypothetical protein HC796_00395 [Synechococcaceae cyanobacterium RL_1_2]|nr:hypothetical protein [Synechococcaceae cyanobacterium RL_1_2]